MAVSNYSNIDLTEQIGNTTNIVLKGTGQIVAHTADEALSTDLNIPQLLAIGIMFTAIAYLIGKAYVSKKRAEGLM